MYQYLAQLEEAIAINQFNSIFNQYIKKIQVQKIILYVVSDVCNLRRIIMHVGR